MEVHPPHQSIHTWRDFFIHIATIVVGLLIAVGLEQTVEWLHRLHEAKETREALKQERELNIKNFHSNVRLARFLLAEEEGNLRVFTFLQQHPGTRRRSCPA
jgi:hypothetical protein